MTTPSDDSTESLKNAMDGLQIPGVSIEIHPPTDEDKRVRRIRYTLTMPPALAEFVFPAN